MAIPDGKPATDFSAMNREWVRAVANEASEGGSTGLPPVTAADNGKILGVVNGAWGAMDAGGGGSSDFSTAEVTFVNTTVDTFVIYMAAAFHDDTAPEDDMTAATVGINASSTNIYTAVLYHGAGMLQLPEGASYTMSATGDIAVYDNIAIITGDGTVTISDGN